MKKITMEQNKSNILTFGSCLSRYTALAYASLFDSNVVSTVFGNRTDLFINSFLKNNDLSISLEQIKNEIELDSDYESFFLRQKRDFIGYHNTNLKEKQKTLWDCFSSNDIDLIFVDNYMDIVARDVYINTPELKDIKFFLPKSRTLHHDKLVLGEYIPINDSVQNFKILIDYLHKNLSNAKIFFIEFPYETYESNTFLTKRFQTFNNKFKNKVVDMIIESHVLSNKLKTKDKQHFDPQFYAAIAAQIYSCTKLTKKKSKINLKINPLSLFKK